MKILRHITLGLSLMWSILLAANAPLDYPLDTIDGQLYYRYTVERSIGLYRISKNFGVSQEEILKCNPEIQEEGLHYDKVILIPVKNITGAEEEVVIAEDPVKKLVEPKKVRSTKIITRKKEKPSIIGTDSIVGDSLLTEPTSSPIRLAIMLPLHAEVVKRERQMERFYDFYCGVLLAINDMQAGGQKIEAYVYDVGKTDKEVERVMSDSLFPEVDAIIGPAYSQQVKMAAKYALEDSTWLLAPFVSSIAGIESNPYILQFNPSKETEADTLARYLAQYGDSVNCVLVESREGDVIPASIAALRKALEKHNIPTTKTTIRDIMNDSINTAFAVGVENFVLFNTEKYGNLQAIMPHLLNASQEHQIVLFSQYSWQTEKIKLPQIYTNIFAEEIAMSDAYKENFDKYFGHTLSSSHPRYDLLGYDLTRQLLELLVTDALGEESTEVWTGYQSSIQYQRQGDGGYENQVIEIIRE